MRFLRAHTDRTIKVTVPGPFTMSQQAHNDHYPDAESAAMAYAEAVNAEVRDLFAAGADIVQIDEPYMQARPDAARAYGLAALNAALAGVRWRPDDVTRQALCWEAHRRVVCERDVVPVYGDTLTRLFTPCTPATR
jgi:methionine synthase II (cobalamin-independent)